MEGRLPSAEAGKGGLPELGRPPAARFSKSYGLIDSNLAARPAPHHPTPSGERVGWVGYPPAASDVPRELLGSKGLFVTTDRFLATLLFSDRRSVSR